MIKIAVFIILSCYTSSAVAMQIEPGESVMEHYRSLEKMFHADPSAERFATNAHEAVVRLESPSTFRTAITLQAGDAELGELFLAMPRELTFLGEEVLRVERKVSHLWANLPGLARWAYLRSLIMDEIVSTNEIEGIHSSRRQVSEALDIVREEGTNPKKARFVELARLYLELTDKHHVYPREPKDIRTIYDRVVAGEIDDFSRPDGRFFRKGVVDIWSPNGRIKHTGVSPESKIEEMLTQMIELVEGGSVPSIYAAFLAHFLFEFIHPFYDGNGRTGRYLLALYLSEPLSITTALSLSKTIAERKNTYYKAFDTVENPLNHGEATFFVYTMMQLVRTAQADALGQLDLKHGQLHQAETVLAEMQEQLDLSDKASQLLFLIVQYALFDEYGAVTLTDAASYMQASTQTARKYFKELEARGLVAVVAQRPLKYTLADKSREPFEVAPLVP